MAPAIAPATCGPRGAARMLIVECIKTGKTPISNGEFGFRMVELIEAASASMRGCGETIHLPKKSK